MCYNYGGKYNNQTIWGKKTIEEYTILDTS